jgi:hypothetical protein
LVAAHIKKNKGKMPDMKDLVKEAGYGKTTSTDVVGGKGFQDLLKEYFPEELLTETQQHSVLAARHGTSQFPKEMKDKDIKIFIESTPGTKLIFIDRSMVFPTAYYTLPEHKSRLTALDMVFRLQNKYPPDKLDVNMDGYANMTDEEVQAKRKEILEQLEKVYARSKSSPRAKKT